MTKTAQPKGQLELLLMVNVNERPKSCSFSENTNSVEKVPAVAFGKSLRSSEGATPEDLSIYRSIADGYLRG